MTTTLNASNSGSGGLVATADASGILALQTAGTTAVTVNASQAVGVGSTPSYGTSGQVLTSAGSAASPTWTTVSTLTSGTAVASTSGTSITFSSLPSTVKRITLMFQGVSTNGSADYLVRIGAGSVTTSGYLGSAAILGTTGTVQNFTTGFGIISNAGYGAASVFHGMMVIALVGSNNWVANYVLGISNATPAFYGGFSLALGGTLDRVVLTTTNGTDTFDAGLVNILYE